MTDAYDLSRIDEYVAELDRASDTLTRVVGFGVGRLGVAGHLEKLFPADDHLPCDDTWLAAVGFLPPGPGGVNWLRPLGGPDQAVLFECDDGERRLMLNGRVVSDWQPDEDGLVPPATRGLVRRLLAGLGVPLTAAARG